MSIDGLMLNGITASSDTSLMAGSLQKLDTARHQRGVCISSTVGYRKEPPRAAEIRLAPATQRRRRSAFTAVEPDQTQARTPACKPPNLIPHVLNQGITSNLSP